MIRFFFVFSLFILFCISRPVGVVALTADEGKLLSSFILNLPDHVRWNDKKEVHICYHGHDSISNALSKVDTSAYQNRLLLGDVKKLEVTLVSVNNLEEIGCDILYISKESERELPYLIQKTEHMGVITVSAIGQFVNRGGVLELKLVRRKVKLKLGEKALERTGVVLSPVILMAIGPEVLRNIRSAQAHE